MGVERVYTRERAQVFGAVAQLYDRARPTYPTELFAHLAAQLAGPRVLEVGAGTGKATLGLAALGLDLTCVEPDPQMAAVLADRVPATVRIEVATFESFTPIGSYDALVSATAWHWTDPATRMDRAAALLRPGGFLGIVWNNGVLVQERAVAAIQEIYDDFGLFGPDRPAEPIGSLADLAAIEDPNTWPGNEIAAHPAFAYLGTSRFRWQQGFTAVQFADFMASTSHYRVLDAPLRGRVLAAVTATIRDRFEDRATIAWSTQCYNARRASGD